MWCWKIFRLYKLYKCRKKPIDKLVEECSEDINGNKLIYNVTLNDYEKVCNSCTIYIVLLVIFFIMTIAYFFLLVIKKR